MAPNYLIAHSFSDEVLHVSANTVRGVICVIYPGRAVLDNFRQAFYKERPLITFIAQNMLKISYITSIN